MQSPQGNVGQSTKSTELSKRITSEMDSNATRPLLARKESPFVPRLPQHVAAAVTIGLALSFAAVVESAAVYASPPVEAVHAEISLQGRGGSESFHYFPRNYKNQATEIGPLSAHAFQGFRWFSRQPLPDNVLIALVTGSTVGVLGILVSVIAYVFRGSK